MPEHIPVLLDEVVEVFQDIESGVVVDCTTGLGGHSKALLSSNPNIELICIDRDTQALEIAKENLKEFKDRVKFIHSNYSDGVKSLAECNIKGILADIGVSSLQLDRANRGFKFDSDNLDMRMDRTQSLRAYDVVNYYSLSELERIFREYAEIREYKKVARLIVNERKNRKIDSSRELASLIERNFKRVKIHPATTTFQAIRIEVNQELKELEELLKFLKERKFKNLTLAIISFHSLEDKIVKNSFREWKKECICPADNYRCECSGDNSLGEIVTKKPITPTKNEISNNPRSRSSKMRIFKFGD